MDKFGIIKFLDKIFKFDPIKKTVPNITDIDFFHAISESISNALKFLFMHTEDLLLFKNLIQSKKSTVIIELYTIVDSLMFYKPVYVADNRFVEDYFGNLKQEETSIKMENK